MFKVKYPNLKITYRVACQTHKTHTVEWADLADGIGWEYGIPDNVYGMVSAGGEDAQWTILKIELDGNTIYDATSQMAEDAVDAALKNPEP